MAKESSKDDVKIKNVTLSFHPEPHFFGALAYMPIIIPALLVYLDRSEDRFIKFHAIQSILFTVIYGIIFILIAAVLALLLPALGVVANVLLLLEVIALLGIWAFTILKAFNGVKYELPIIGGLASKYAK